MPKMPPLTPQQRSLRARIGAFAQHRQNDVSLTTAKAREAFNARFYEGLDEVPEPERTRRATARRSEYFSRLAFERARGRNQVSVAAAEDAVNER